MSEFKPGDVALARWNRDPVIATATGEGGRVAAWHFVSPAGSSYFRKSDDPNFTIIRRLAVIDPEDREQVNRLADAFCAERWCHTSSGDTDECDPLTRSSMQAALREYASPTPPKPDEPMGLGAVVEDAEGVRWVRIDPYHSYDLPWHNLARGFRSWESLTSTTVLRDGWLPEGVQR